MLSEKSPRLKSIYKNHKPQLNGEVSLLMKLRNKTQENDLIKEKKNILLYLKKQLKNARLELNFIIDTNDDNTTQKAFTATDKYKLMAEKNPSMALFKREFNLDFD